MDVIVDMLRDDWQPRSKRNFQTELRDKSEIWVKIPLPSHGRTSSYLDIADELLEASYFCESLARAFDCFELERKFEKNKDFYLLRVSFHDADLLASRLFKLQWAFNSSEKPSRAEKFVRRDFERFRSAFTRTRLLYPELADLHLLHKVIGVYPQYGFELYTEELAEFPERRLGFYRSNFFLPNEDAVLQSIDSWVIPNSLSPGEAFRRLSYPEPVSLLNADLLIVNQSAIFLSEGVALKTSLQDLSDVITCRRFASDDTADIIWPGVAKAYVSEFKDFGMIELGGVTSVLFGVEEIRKSQVATELSVLQARNDADIYVDPSAMIDWSAFDDERFEKLCYDIIYQHPNYDSETIRKMGKSRSRDGGRDIQVMTRPALGKPPKLTIVQCKKISSGKSLTTHVLGSVSDVVDQYGAGRYVVMTSGVIDATVFDRLDGIKRSRELETETWSVLEIERFLARRPSIMARYKVPAGE